MLTAPPLGDLPDGEYWVHELVGSVLVDLDGVEHGNVAHVEANPASDILVLDDGGMVPVVFVRSVEPGRVIGLSFVAPVDFSPTVQVTSGAQTSRATAERVGACVELGRAHV